MNGEIHTHTREILVADDDPAILRLIGAIVEKEGFKVIAANDGREAFRILGAYDNLTGAIFDVVMPYIQGTELVRHMQSEERLARIPVIIMTAEENHRLSAESFAYGAVAFLTKPFTVSQLQKMIRTFTEK